jgi:CRISPR/Cas system-associated endonuclease Cas3-HD
MSTHKPNGANKRRRLQGRQRMRLLRQRAKRKDPISYYPVPLPVSVVHTLAAGLKVERSNDKPFTDLQWRELVGRVIARVVELTVKK